MFSKSIYLKLYAVLCLVMSNSSLDHRKSKRVPEKHLQGRNRDADVESKLGDTVGEGEGGPNCESSIDTHTPTLCETDS